MKKSVSVTVELTLTTIIYHFFLCFRKKAPKTFEYGKKEKKKTVQVYK